MEIDVCLYFRQNFYDVLQKFKQICKKKKIPITNCYSHFCAMNSATSDLYA